MNLFTISMLTATAVLFIIALGAYLFAPRRNRDKCIRLVSEARQLMANGIYATDKHGRPGPVELLGEAYRLQTKARLSAAEVGLRHEGEMDDLINEVIDHQGPPERPSVRALTILPPPLAERPQPATDDNGSIPAILMPTEPMAFAPAGMPLPSFPFEDKWLATDADDDEDGIRPTLPRLDVADVDDDTCRSVAAANKSARVNSADQEDVDEILTNTAVLASLPPDPPDGC